LYGLRVALRIVASTASLVALYYLAPLQPRGDASALVMLFLALVAVAVLVIVQVRGIVSSPVPRLRAVEGLAATIPLLLVSFSACYVVMSEAAPATFNQPLTRTDALYFTVTVFATVGFGDLAAATQAGRAVVTVQMVVDLLVVGFGLRIITSAVQLGRERRAATTGTPPRGAADGSDTAADAAQASGAEGAPPAPT
jgi:hypothetical protein